MSDVAKKIDKGPYIYGLDHRGGYLIGRATPDGTIAEVEGVAGSVEEARRIADKLNVIHVGARSADRRSAYESKV